MELDLAPVRTYLQAADCDAYLVAADGSDPDQRYLSGFDAPDPFYTLVTPEAVVLLVSGLEYGRARDTARADRVVRTATYDLQDRQAEHGREEGAIRALAAFLRDNDATAVAVPRGFPVGTADRLRELGLTVSVETSGIVEDLRAVKADAEIDMIRETQRANEAAMAAAERLIAGATVEGDRLSQEGTALTSERVKEEIEVTLLGHRCGLDDAIVACGADGADPHDRGSGPLCPDQPIVVDIFPRHKEHGYFGDLTRTFCRGSPPDELQRRYRLTREAMEAALAVIEPGVTGAAVHEAACEVYEAAGFATLRSDPTTETGFIHGTGHGVGLAIHERPRLAPGGPELEVGNVVTVEPGLYDPSVGGVRIEDLVVVTEDGYRNLTDYRIDLTPTTG